MEEALIIKKSTEYADSKLDKDCPYSKNVQRKERQFDWADIADAFEAGAKWADETLTNKALKWFDEYFLCLPPDFESMFREAMKKPSYEQNN